MSVRFEDTCFYDYSWNRNDTNTWAYSLLIKIKFVKRKELKYVKPIEAWIQQDGDGHVSIGSTRNVEG
jgi:hypothetical protein